MSEDALRQRIMDALDSSEARCPHKSSAWMCNDCLRLAADAVLRVVEADALPDDELWVSRQTHNRYYRRQGSVYRDMTAARARCETPIPDHIVLVQPEQQVLMAMWEGRRPSPELAARALAPEMEGRQP